MNRRTFFSTAAATGLLARQRVMGANERVRVGLIGSGGRGTYVAGIAAKIRDCEVVATADAAPGRREATAVKMGPQAKPVTDYRQILDNNEIDAVIIGSPDHWHARMVLDAVAAGKDVYCEKPVTHDVSEGDKLIAGVEQSKRVVATGTQQRSWDHFILAKQLIDSGQIGQVIMAQTYWYQNYIRLKWREEQLDPTTVDWKAWLGSAPDQPFSLVRFRHWRFFWDFGGGAFTDLMTHWIDVVQWFMNSPTLKTVQASGTTHVLTELQCPDTVNAAILYPENYTATYSGTMTSSIEDGGIVFRGTNGAMRLTRDGFTVYREATPKKNDMFLPDPEITMKSSGDGTISNVENWLSCIRSRKLPNAHIRAGVQAARTSHLANQAMRQGKIISPGA